MVGAKLRDQMGATTHRGLEISRAARSRGRNARQRLERGYRRLLATVRSAMRDTERVGAELLSGTRKVVGERGRLEAAGARAELEHFLPLVRAETDVEFSEDRFLLRADDAKKHIEPPRLARIEVKPTRVRLKLGEQAVFVVSCFDQHGSLTPAPT